MFKLCDRMALGLVALYSDELFHQLFKFFGPSSQNVNYDVVLFYLICTVSPYHYYYYYYYHYYYYHYYYYHFDQSRTLPGCDLLILLSLLAIFNTLSECMPILFSWVNGLNTKILESAIFVWYKNGRQRLLGAQSINTERASLTPVFPTISPNWKQNTKVTANKLFQKSTLWAIL